MRYILAILTVLLLTPSVVHASPLRGINVYNQVNEIRIQNGLKPLRPDPILVKAAQLKADDMAKRNYFAHRSPLGWNVYNFIRAAHGSYLSMGENLAMNYTSTEDTVTAWMNSPTHREIIMDDDWLNTGIAINGKYVVQYFSTAR